jgi:hypothetical protein
MTNEEIQQKVNEIFMKYRIIMFPIIYIAEGSNSICIKEDDIFISKEDLLNSL